MNYETFISPKELLAHLDNPDVAVFDCRFDLQDPSAAERAYLEAHIPGSQYVHLEDDLCGPSISGETNQHPFPEPKVFTQKLSGWGVDQDVQVVAYDDFLNGFAARFWQMLRWLGHERVAILDGGWSGWKKFDLPITGGKQTREARSFNPKIQPMRVLDTTRARMLWERGKHIFIDTRTPERYSGKKPPDSPTSGHIPGAEHLFFADHFAVNGFLKPNDQLRDLYHQILQGKSGNQAILYCSTGVTASVSIAVMKHLGLDEPALYADSWEGWCLQADPPVEKNPDNI